MTNYSFGKLLKRSVSRGGLAVLLGLCCMSAVGQESDRQNAADVKSASLERAEPGEELNAAMEKYLQSAEEKKLIKAYREANGIGTTVILYNVKNFCEDEYVPLITR